MNAYEFQAGCRSGQGKPLIELQSVVKTFRTPAGDFTALKGIDVCFYQGEFVSVVGRSGSGKSTLMNMITGIDHPTSGVVRVGDTLLHQLNESRTAVWRGKNLGIVFQFYQLLPMLSLLENVMLPMDFSAHTPPADRQTRAMQLLDRVGLADFAHKLPAAVSGGQQQSAAIARALANDPPILIADEPTGNLDSLTAENVMALFDELVAQGKTIVMVTHDPWLAQRTQRMLLISDGELIPPAIAAAFPGMAHNRLLELAHAARQEHYTDGQPIPQDGLARLLLYGVVAWQVGGNQVNAQAGELLPESLPEKAHCLGQAEVLAFERRWLAALQERAA